MIRSPIRNDAGEVVSALDWLGNRFSVGDTVLYCVGAGRGQLMAYGKVLKIRACARTKWDPEVRDVVHFEDITVSVLTERTSGEWDNGKRSRPGSVNPLNITALPVLIG